MKTLYLHIGTHKTGSTSIQEWCSTNVERLLRDGIYYPDFFEHEKGNHSPMAWAFSGDPRAQSFGTLNDLDANLKRVTCESILCSGEEFEFLNDGEVQDVASFFDSYNVKVLLFLRPQSELLRAEYVEWLKQGLTSDQFSTYWRLQMTMERYAYDTLYDRWAKNFGAENVSVVSYPAVARDPMGIAGSVASWVDIDASDYAKVQRKNVSPSRLVVESWKYAINKIEFVSGVDYSVSDFMYNERGRQKRKNMHRLCRLIEQHLYSSYDNSESFTGYALGEEGQCASFFERSNANLFSALNKTLWTSSETCAAPADWGGIPLQILLELDELVIDFLREEISPVSVG